MYETCDENISLTNYVANNITNIKLYLGLQTSVGFFLVLLYKQRCEDIIAYHVDELRKLELYFNGEGICDVDHWTNQLVVVRQEVVV